MRAIITDRKALSEVQPQRVVLYLEHRGWRREKVTSSAITWKLDKSQTEQFEIEMPKQADVGDFALRVSELLHTLGIVEARSQLEIFKDIHAEETATEAVLHEGQILSTEEPHPSSVKLSGQKWLVVIAVALSAGFLGALLCFALLSPRPQPPPVTPVVPKVVLVDSTISLVTIGATVLGLLGLFPGLALVFSGLVRRKNVLSVIIQCWVVIGVVTVLWFAFAWSLAFGEGNAIIGRPVFALNSSGIAATFGIAPSLSPLLFISYHLLFPLMASMLLVGAVAERVRAFAYLLVVLLWTIAVFCPIAHMMWSSNGLMNGLYNQAAAIKAIDFAGGAVVHLSGGCSALVFCLILGKRLGFGKEPMIPHSMVLTSIGTGLLWVGWHGLVIGRAFGSSEIITTAFVAVLAASATGCITWFLLEYFVRGKGSALGLASGTLAGLVVITPASGFVDLAGACNAGVAGATITFFAVNKLKHWLGYDDSLDIFGLHGVGGALGMILTGFLAKGTVNTSVTPLLNGLLGNQLKAVSVTIVISVVGTAVVAFFVKAIVGLRVSEDEETVGLDLAQHGEEGYHGD